MNDSKKFAVCVRNDGYEVSLQLRKVYEVLDDDFADQHKMIRVIDETGEDYLFSQKYFVRVELPEPSEQTLLELMHSR